MLTENQKEMKLCDLPCLISMMLKSQLPWIQDLILLFIRIIVGWGFLVVGKTKLVNLDYTASAFESLGILVPSLIAGLLGVVETVGGLLLVAGLLSRLAAANLAISMIGVYIISQGENAFGNIGGSTLQSPCTFVFGSLVIFAFGTGRLALDNVLARFTCKGWQP